MTDEQTDRQTDGFAIAYSALSMLSRAKNNTFVAVGSKYDITSYNTAVKPAVWTVFATSLESVLS